MTEGAALAALDELPVSGDGVEDAPLRQETAVGDVVTRSAPADSLEKASSVSGKLGGVAGVFAGAIICTGKGTERLPVTHRRPQQQEETYAEVACLSVADGRLFEVDAERRLQRRKQGDRRQADGPAQRSGTHLELPLSGLEQLLRLVARTASREDELVDHDLLTQGVHGARRRRRQDDCSLPLLLLFSDCCFVHRSSVCSALALRRRSCGRARAEPELSKS